MSLLRVRSGAQRVTNIEVFFDLVYAFAITQLSQHLLGHPTGEGGLQTLLLLAVVWLAWAYTAWVTNWLDPDRPAVRLLLVMLMAVSLVMSAALPVAFSSGGLVIGGAYATMQIGRTIFVVAVLSGLPPGSRINGLAAGRLQRNFQRVLVWCVASGALAVIGGLEQGHLRELFWLFAVGVDLAAGPAGFYTPGLGRSSTRDWNIDGDHLAERSQGFLIIALGESIVVIGSGLADITRAAAATIAAFVVAFAGAVALWWVYFDRSAEAAQKVIAESRDPGRIGRDAYHLIHPVMVAGIIVVAAADERVLRHPLDTPDWPTTLMVLGGAALFLAGHALFKASVWNVVPWSRLAAIVVLAALVLVAPLVSALGLALCALAILIAVSVADRLRAAAAETRPRPRLARKRN